MPNNKYYLLGEGPYPYKFDSEDFSKHVDYYESQNISIVAPRLPMNMKIESHVHDSYEFTIPLSQSPLISIDNKEILSKKNTLTTSNPDQIHGPACNIRIDNFIAIQISRTFIENISEEMNGKRSVKFDNSSVIVPSNLYNQIREYIVESNYCQKGYKFIIEALSIQMAVNLLRNVKNNTPEIKDYNTFCYSKNVKRAVEFMYENCTRNFTIDRLAQEVNLSKYHFIRIFKSETGITPYEYMMDIKICKAKQLFKSRQHTITEVCYLLGFNDHSHFTKTFKKKTGLTPRQFIEQIV